MLLAARGFAVTVFEKGPRVGGRNAGEAVHEFVVGHAAPVAGVGVGEAHRPQAVFPGAPGQAHRPLRVVREHGAEDDFIGHIGGDDFIFNVALDKMRVCCEEVIEVFDELIPYQYTPEDRRAGYFLGRDRRGNIVWVPLMTLSIGVVTNQHRRFEHTARVSELATEMKTFAKKLPGSVYSVDRRADSDGTYYGRSIVTTAELEAKTDELEANSDES